MLLLGIIPGMHKWFNTYKSTNGINYINNSKIRNHVVTLIGTEETLAKTRELFVKTSEETQSRMNIAQNNKDSNKPRTNII